MALLLTQTEIPLEGTQPDELMAPPEPSSRCGCHFDFDQDVYSEPGQSYSATAMALSALDPLFQAALSVAHDDEPRLSPTCLRCHAPAAWLAGRSQPGDGSSLEAEDLEGVTCDVCHRMVEPESGMTHIGDGQYVISDSVDKRGPRGTPPLTGHRIVRSDYLKSSEVCGVCHSLFNPLEHAHDPDGRDLGFNYYEQRTFEEWRDSKFATEKSCIDCHMKRVEGYSCREQTNLYPDLAHHAIVGANSFVGKAVALLYPNMELGAQADRISEMVREQLASAADLEIISAAPEFEVESGETVALTVRLTNKTGHKLPTGYPEGRRVYLEVTLKLAGSSAQMVTGRWDPATGDLVEDAQLHTYETKHGRVGVGRTQHLALANQVLTDTRIPPEGFMPTAADMHPFGRDYGSPPYRHYDEPTFEIPIPRGIKEVTTGTITVRALHQLTSGSYVGFLLDKLGENHERARKLKTAYIALGRVPPEVIATASHPLRVIEKKVIAPPDAGNLDAAAASEDTRTETAPSMKSGDCGCRTSSSPIDHKSDSSLILFALFVLLGVTDRRRLDSSSKNDRS